MNDEGVCRTAPAAPGLLKMYIIFQIFLSIALDTYAEKKAES